ncbi:MAG TPA: thiamine biosynthesis protein [Nitrosopumilaceae archaeon]|nr:thiamine biosynthesis protein [Nitrosopumilaceae archaeon]
MSDNVLVIFPSIFTHNKLDFLVSNIKKILEIQNQKFQKVRKDDSVIIVEANDPVFASSTINLLFGIERIAIAKQVKNEFDTIITEITKIGSNLLLKGDRFYIKVDGSAKGFLPKDVEITATSSLIEKTIKIGAKPGTEDNYDKLLYTFLTKSNAYVCIFSDKGHGGIPNNSQNEKSVCCIYDEISAISCLETIRQGFDVKIIVCYHKKSDLLNLVKIVNKIIPRTLKQKIELEFFQILINGTSTQNYLLLVETVTELMLLVAITNKVKRISLAVSPLVFPQFFIDKITAKAYKKNILPQIPLSGIDEDILTCTKEIGLEKYLSKIERLGKIKFNSDTKNNNNSQKIAQQILKTKRAITITIGPNNIHDIMDGLESNH